MDIIEAIFREVGAERVTMNKSTDCVVSVIIATRNRAEELATISLPSLGRQDSNDFETVVWDASDGDSSRLVVEKFAEEHPERIVRYFKAHRAGLPAQRNDAVREARGEIVFFIDDDSEVSPDGIAAIAEVFQQGSVSGAGLCLDYRWPTEVIALTRHRTDSRLRRFFGEVFEPSYRASGLVPFSPSRDSGAETLCGCNMAFRKTTLAEHGFDERFQRYAGYALWEDRAYCQSLTSRGLTLRTAARGQITHWGAPGERIPFSFNRGQVEGYNSSVLWYTGLFPSARWTILPFVWARIGFLGVVLFPCLAKPWQLERWKRVTGYLAGLWVFFWEEVALTRP